MNEEAKTKITEIVTILKQLGPIDLMLIKNSGDTLLARDKLAREREQEKELVGTK